MISSIDLFFRRDWALGADPLVDAPRVEAPRPLVLVVPAFSVSELGLLVAAPKGEDVCCPLVDAGFDASPEVEVSFCWLGLAPKSPPPEEPSLVDGFGPNGEVCAADVVAGLGAKSPPVEELSLVDGFPPPNGEDCEAVDVSDLLPKRPPEEVAAGCDVEG